jgi:uncharacterized protein YbaP (TraB family)
MMLALSWAACVLAALPADALAQETADPEVATSLEDIIVVARRAGAPIWEISLGQGTVIAVGSVEGIPRDLRWNARALQAAVARSDRVLLPLEERESLRDIGRLIWRSRSILTLPDGEVVSDYVDAELYRRLEKLLTDENPRWRRRSLHRLAHLLIEDIAGLRGGGESVATIVGREAARHNVLVEPVGMVRGDQLLGSLINGPQSSHLECLSAAVAAAEGGPDATQAMFANWRRAEVTAVWRSPINAATSLCWPWSHTAVVPAVRDTWIEAISIALQEDGTTLAVTPLRGLVEPGGILERLQNSGASISGPDWHERP